MARGGRLWFPAIIHTDSSIDCHTEELAIMAKPWVLLQFLMIKTYFRFIRQLTVLLT